MKPKTKVTPKATMRSISVERVLQKENELRVAAAANAENEPKTGANEQKGRGDAGSSAKAT
jgi:hypothetical protein